MTALDEGRHLADAVSSVFAQDYTGHLELIVAVGPSRDDTMAIAIRLAATDARLKVVANPSGRTPAGLNIAIEATDPQSQIIVRTDGHATLPANYVRRAVTTLERTGAGNVGGMMVPIGTTSFEKAVARAMSRKIGIGPAPFHVGGAPGEADTVYLGVFRRDVLAAVGGFDEHYVRAQDWELNYRIRTAGHRVHFDPRLQVEYRPRPNVARLARQFHDSGVWRWQIISRRPDTASARYLAPPLATVSLAASAVGALVNVRVRSRAVCGTSTIAPVLYLTTIAGGAIASGRGLGIRAGAYYPLALVTMHLSWGTGFLRAMVSTLTGRR